MTGKQIVLGREHLRVENQRRKIHPFDFLDGTQRKIADADLVLFRDKNKIIVLKDRCGVTGLTYKLVKQKKA